MKQNHFSKSCNNYSPPLKHTMHCRCSGMRFFFLKIIDHKWDTFFAPVDFSKMHQRERAIKLTVPSVGNAIQVGKIPRKAFLWKISVGMRDKFSFLSSKKCGKCFIFSVMFCIMRKRLICDFFSSENLNENFIRLKLQPHIIQFWNITNIVMYN